MCFDGETYHISCVSLRFLFVNTFASLCFLFVAMVTAYIFYLFEAAVICARIHMLCVNFGEVFELLKLLIY